MERLSTRTGSILRGTVLFWIFYFSRAGFGSAILEPRKARIYTEALARKLFRVILCVPWLILERGVRRQGVEGYVLFLRELALARLFWNHGKHGFTRKLWLGYFSV
jgi:hypothetical protein